MPDNTMIQSFKRHMAGFAVAVGVGLAALGSATAPAAAAGDYPILKPLEGPIAKPEWSFAGLFGTYDQQQLQRGLQVYRQNCRPP